MTTVGIVTEWFDRGSAFVSKALSQTLRAAGVDVAIFARGEFRELGASFWPFDNLTFAQPCPLSVPKAIKRSDFTEWIRRVKPDAILFNEQVWICPVEWANALGIPTIAYVDYYTRWSIREMDAYDLLICNTRRHASAMSWHPNMVYIPWGTDLTDYHVRNEPSLEGRPVVFLHSAGWNPYRKGTDQVLRAFDQLHRDDVRLRIAIQGSLDKLTKLLDRDEFCILDNPKIELLVGNHGPEFFASGDVYVYPSRLEGIGLTQVEAIASGLPILVPDEPPMSEFAASPHSMTIPVVQRTRRIDGYYWPEVEVSVDDLARAMDSYASDDSRPHWKGESRSWAEENLDWAQNSTELAPAVHKLISEYPHRKRSVSINCRLGGFASELPTPLSASYGIAWRLHSRMRRLFHPS